MNRKQMLGAAAVLAAITVLVYCPAMRAGFVWDDGDMVTNNPLIKSAGGLRDIWLGDQLTDYHPLTYSVFWLEWRCWGMNPAGYHVVNILIHAGNVVLLWLVLRKLRIPGSWLAALFFGVHPVCVASVAWIAELKNTLSMLFYLWALYCWLRSEDREKWDVRYYALALVFFLLALLAKVSVSVLPFVLLLLAWWRRGRVSRQDWMRAAPFLVLAVGLGSYGMTFQNRYTVLNESLPLRLLGGSWAVWFYLWKICWPAHLTIIYPRWSLNAAAPLAYIPGVCFAAMLCLFWRNRAGWGKPWFFAAAYFVIALAPVLGPVKLVYLYFSQAADHLQYLALPGMVALAVAGGWRWLRGNRAAGGAAAGAVAAGLLVLTWQSQSRFADMSSMWRDNLARNPTSFQALLYVGAQEEGRGHYDAAGDLFRRALALRPQSPEANINLAIVLDDLGKTEEAIAQTERTLKFKPDDPDAHVLLARLLERQGRQDEAVSQLWEAIRWSPDHVAAHQNLGNLLLKEGRWDEAVRQLGYALKQKSDDPTLFVALGNAQGKRGDMEAALACFQKALTLDPNSADASNGLAAVRRAQGK